MTLPYRNNILVQYMYKYQSSYPSRRLDTHQTSTKPYLFKTVLPIPE